MELRLKKERFERMICVLNRTTEDAFTADVVVPDTLPDVSSVLLSDGDFCLWRLDLSDGSAEAEGEWKGSVCCQSESDNRLFSFPVTVGVRLRLHDDAIKPELRPVAEFHVTEATAQMMNSRKLRMKIRVSCGLRGYAPDTLELSAGIEEPTEDVFSKLEEVSFSSVLGVEEQVFTVSGSNALSQPLSEGGLLSSHSEIVVEESQITTARAVFRGYVQTEVLYLPENETIPIQESIRSSFSQLLDIDQALASDTLRFRLQLTSADLTQQNEKALETEFHIVAQVLHIRDIRTHVLTDAYSVTNQLSPESARFDLLRLVSDDPIRLTVEAEAECKPEDERILAALAQIRSVQMTRDHLRGAVSCRVLLRQENGMVRSETLSQTFEVQTDRDCCLSKPVRIASAKAQLAGGKLSLHADLTADLVERIHSTAEQIITLECMEGETAPYDLPAVTLVPRSEQQDLWTLAKKYASSIEAIEQVNGIGAKEGESRYLLIPRIQMI